MIVSGVLRNIHIFWDVFEAKQDVWWTQPVGRVLFYVSNWWSFYEQSLWAEVLGKNGHLLGSSKPNLENQKQELFISTDGGNFYEKASKNDNHRIRARRYFREKICISCIWKWFYKKRVPCVKHSLTVVIISHIFEFANIRKKFTI